MTLIAGSNKRRCLLLTGDGRRSVYDKKHQRYAEDNRTEQNLIVRICKSEAEVTNNRINQSINQSIWRIFIAPLKIKFHRRLALEVLYC